ncbi:MAG TPA: zinc ABC transporter substrate-binding protein [Caldimonas sp.]|jgi:zinc/manganese transport system substrate-binding protein|nr:zinc ABC transporter substrate-binding protein [Caldimonas sp.]HEX2541400.1 zinc ABC transporter substrate-binding protein [Caldimonas sp.]
MPRIRSDRRGWRRLVLALGLTLAGGAAQALTVFACEPEWAALVRAFAPDAQVRTATHARQDPHHIEARPSLIAAMRQADLAVCAGASLEAGWLPMLQQRSGNPRVQPGAPGLFMAADSMSLIDPRPAGTPFEGDVHTEGNPHFHLDPRRMLQVAEALAGRLQAIEPQRRAEVQGRFAAWAADWRTRIDRWERQAQPLRGTRVVGQHTTYAYLWRWLGIEQAADLEPRPGMSPTPGHLQRVLEQARAMSPRAIVVSSYQDPRAAQWLSQQLGGSVPVLQLPATLMDEGPASTLAGFYDHLLERLLAGR